MPTDGYDALLWNDGDGTFTEGAAKAGITAPGWHSGAAVGDVNGDGRPDLFVASYADPNVRVESSAGFPTNHLAVRDLLYLNVGTDDEGARPSARSRRLPASSGSSSDTGSARCSPTSTATDDSTCTSRTTPTRTSSTGTSR